MVVVNLLAPINQVFWGCAQYPAYVGLPTLTHDHSDKERGGLAMGLKKLLRNTKVTLESPQLLWFQQYAEVAGKTKRSVPSLSTPELSYLEVMRWVHITVRKSRLATLQHILETEVTQFEKFAFWTCDERIRLNSSIDGLESANSGLFAGPGLISMELARDFPQAYSCMQRSVLSELRVTIQKLKAGVPFDYQLNPKLLIGGVSFWRTPSNWPRATEVRKLEDEINSNKAHLVRLLGWPTQYHAKKMLVRAENSIEKWGDITYPYNFLNELSEYVTAMESEYSVLVSCSAVEPAQSVPPS